MCGAINYNICVASKQKSIIIILNETFFNLGNFFWPICRLRHKFSFKEEKQTCKLASSFNWICFIKNRCIRCFALIVLTYFISYTQSILVRFVSVQYFILDYRCIDAHIHIYDLGLEMQDGLQTTAIICLQAQGAEFSTFYYLLFYYL